MEPTSSVTENPNRTADEASADDFLAPDVARFLSKFAPDLVKLLRARHPTAAAALREDGTVLGQADRELSIDAVKAFLSRVKDAAFDGMAQAGARLRLANRFDLIGGVLASSSTAGVVVSALGSDSVWGPVVLGIVGFIASIVPLAARWLRTATTGRSGAAFQQLREAVWEADELRVALDRITEGDNRKFAAAVKKANAIAKKAYLALTDLGYEPSFGAV